MTGRSDGNDRHACDVEMTEASVAGVEPPCNADGRGAAAQGALDAAKRFAHQPQRHGRELCVKVPKYGDQPVVRKQGVDNQGNLRLELIEQAVDARKQSINTPSNGSRFRDDRLASCRECRLACAPTVKQRYTQLLFKSVDRIADRGRRASQSLRCGRKASGLDNAQQHQKLIDARQPGRPHFDSPEHNFQIYMDSSERREAIGSLHNARAVPPGNAETTPPKREGATMMAANPNELTIENSALILIDHQPAVAVCAPSLRTDVLINNVAGLAKSAKLLGVPTVLTTVGAQGSILVDPIFKEIGEIFPETSPIDRTSTHAWSHPDVRAAVDKTQRRKLVMAGILTEVCLAQSVLAALKDGFEVYFVSDCSAGATQESQ